MILVMLLAIENDEDRHLLHKLYQELYPVMKAKAYKIVANQREAEDIVQNATLRIIEHLPKLRKLNKYHQVTYICKTVESTAIDYIRKEGKHKRSNSIEDIAYDLQDENEAPVTEKYEYIEKYERMGMLLNSLSDRDKSLLYQKYFLDLTDEQIAINHDMEHGAVRTALSRLRNKVKRIFIEAGIQ